LISIVTPALCWNGWLPLCLESVADQEVHHEHIVQLADGAGFLGCPADHVRCYVEDDDGMYDALNKGYRKARGQIIAHLNCDEQYLPGTLAAVCQYFDSHPEIDILCGDTLVTATDGRLLAVRRSLIPTWFDENVRVRIQTCSMFFRRKIIDDGEYLETSMPVAADIEWIRRLRRKGYTFGRLPLLTSTFTETGTNLSLTPAAAKDRQVWRSRWAWWVRPTYPAQIAFYRLRTLFAGYYRREAVQYSIYTLDDVTRRKHFKFDAASFIWPGRQAISLK
jgi:glycosyltransferase involved in cell wall biosynthesis